MTARQLRLPRDYGE